MEVNYNGIVINKTDKQEYLDLSHKANIGREKEKIENEKNAYLKKQKEVKKFQIAAEKRKITDLAIIKKGNEQKIKNLKADSKKQIADEIKRLDSLSTTKYISENVELTKEDLEVNLGLLKHKYHINSDAYKKGSEKLIKKSEAKIADIRKYSVDDEQLKLDKENFRNKNLEALAKETTDIEGQILINKKEIVAQKEAFSKFKKEFRPVHKQKVSDRKNGFRSEKHEARVNARVAKKEIVASNVYLNSFYEPVIDEPKAGTKSKIKLDWNTFIKTQKEIKKSKISFEKNKLKNNKVSKQEFAIFRKDFIASQNNEIKKRKEEYRVELLKAKEEFKTTSKAISSSNISIDKNEDFYKEKKHLKVLKIALEKQLLKNDDAFDSKAKIIELKYKIEYFGNILKIKTKYAKKINDHHTELVNDKENLNKKDIEEKFKENKAKILETKKSEVSRIKDQYRKGVFSKSSKKNSLQLAKKTAKSDIREAKLKNPLLINSEKARFLKIEESRMISKQKTLMYSIIDDAVKNIPTKSIKKQRFLAAFMSLILPGTGQMLNKQYVKGILLLLLAAFVYGFLLPVAAGWIAFKGDGINGLGTLSPAKNSFIGITYEDARFRMIEGIVAMFAIVIGLASLILSSKDAYLFAKARELGLRPKNSRDLKRYFKSSGLPYLLSLPAAIAILFIVLLPLVATIMLGFTNYSTGHIPPGNPLSWAGFDNFKMVFTGDYAQSFGFVAIWTVIWTVAVSFGVIALGTFLAFVVDQKRIKGKILFTTVFILPWAVPAFATILFFSAALDNGGLYQHLFNTHIDFKQNANWTKGLLITLQIWLGHSYIFLLMMGVKKSISKDFYEAASIDGASKWAQFWKISAPIIMFQIAPLLIGQIVFNFNNYGIIWMFNDGGPASSQSLIGNPGSTDIFLSLIFKMTTSSATNRIALASAFTIVVSIGVVLISAIGFVRSKSFKGEM